MVIERLEIRDIRNLVEVSLEPGPGINVVEGANGSGKTSLLEAIHLAGMGRSFLSLQHEVFVRHGVKEGTVFCIGRRGADVFRIGVRKEVRGGTELRFDGEVLASRAALVRLMPVAVIAPGCQVLLEGAPKERRSYLDWGLFHVEQFYLNAWRDYQRALRQRNQALQRHEDTVDAWDGPFINAAEALTRFREDFLFQLEIRIHDALAALEAGFLQPHISYERGWSRDKELDLVLSECRARDLRDGFTHVGPHRADIRLRIDGKPVAQMLSRGQKKLLVCALWLAQIAVVAECAGRQSVVLVDDLPAELDTDNRVRLLGALSSQGAQVFTTTTDRALTPFDRLPSPTLFHVEQGRVRRVV